LSKENWYTKVEGTLKEMRTIDIAIKNLEDCEDEESQKRLEEKLKFRDTMDEIFDQLNEFEFKLIGNFYIKEKTPIEMEDILGVSSATFYRAKRRVARTIAKYLGIV
jgi:DNA-directed RNA polymerase specialized sigma subunit